MAASIAGALALLMLLIAIAYRRRNVYKRSQLGALFFPKAPTVLSTESRRLIDELDPNHRLPCTLAAVDNKQVPSMLPLLPYYLDPPAYIGAPQFQNTLSPPTYRTPPAYIVPPVPPATVAAPHGEDDGGADYFTKVTRTFTTTTTHGHDTALWPRPDHASERDGFDMDMGAEDHTPPPVFISPPRFVAPPPMLATPTLDAEPEGWTSEPSVASSRPSSRRSRWSDVDEEDDMRFVVRRMSMERGSSALSPDAAVAPEATDVFFEENPVFGLGPPVGTRESLFHAAKQLRDEVGGAVGSAHASPYQGGTETPQATPTRGRQSLMQAAEHLGSQVQRAVSSAASTPRTPQERRPYAGSRHRRRQQFLEQPLQPPAVVAPTAASALDSNVRQRLLGAARQLSSDLTLGLAEAGTPPQHPSPDGTTTDPDTVDEDGGADEYRGSTRRTMRSSATLE